MPGPISNILQEAASLGRTVQSDGIAYIYFSIYDSLALPVDVNRPKRQGIALKATLCTERAGRLTGAYDPGPRAAACCREAHCGTQWRGRLG